jgi:hypothetical protein
VFAASALRRLRYAEELNTILNRLMDPLQIPEN